MGRQLNQSEARRRYEMFVSGVPMAHMEQVFGVSKQAIHQSARVYAERHGLPAPERRPPPNCEAAYKMKLAGFTWSEIAAALGYAGTGSAASSAAHWANQQGLRWPPARMGHRKAKKARRQGRPPLPDHQRAVHRDGEKAYRLRKAGEQWETIAQECGHRSPGAVYEAAKSYARQQGLAFPLKVRTK